MNLGLGPETLVCILSTTKAQSRIRKKERKNAVALFIHMDDDMMKGIRLKYSCPLNNQN